MYAYPHEETAKLAPAGDCVGLVNTYSTRNLGDAAIMAALAKLAPTSRVLANIQEASPCPIPGVELVDSLGDCGSFVSVGGDIFNNARPAFVTRNFLNNVIALYRNRRRAIVFGQTIPSSCRGFSLTLLAETLRRTRSVTVRDVESHRLLQNHGVSARLSFDAAFVLQPAPAATSAAESIYAAAGFTAGRTALISVRGFDGMYRQSPETSLAKLVELARLLNARGHQVGVLIQSDAGASDSDRFVAQRILSHVPEARAFDLFDGPGQVAPVELLCGVLRLANIVVGLRYHTCVLRLAGGRHPFNLPYSRKGRDLGERLALTGCALEHFVPSEQIGAIEATAGRAFDADPVARHVASSFADAFGALA